MNIKDKHIICSVLFIMAIAILFTTCKKVEIPTQPTEVKAFQEGATVIVSWKSVKNATNYRIYRTNSKDYIPIATVSKSGTTEEKFVDNSPLNGMNYYKVTAFNEDIESLEGGYATCNFTFYLPILTTLQPTNITLTSATLGGNISDAGNPVYTERGVCWSTTINPTTANNKQQIAGSGTGDFTTNVTGLVENTTYYIRAYATNSQGTAYGEQVSFKIKKGVLINGVYWALCNVNMPGFFAANPEDAGMFYQWNRKMGWSSTDPMVNSNGGTTWDSSIPSGNTWAISNDPSPVGWRVPTEEEISALLNTTYVHNVWTTENGVKGRRFTDKNNGNSIFLPAAGYRSNLNGTLSNVGAYGYYWSSTECNASVAWGLVFYSSDVYRDDYGKTLGFSVRPVAE